MENPCANVIMNESFSATTLEDARFIGANVLRQLIDLDLLCVCVTILLVMPWMLTTLLEFTRRMFGGIAGLAG